MLCQIGKCAVYAEQHGRVLVIGTRITGFQEPFGQYFESLNPRIVFATRQLLDYLNTLDVYPDCVKGKIHTYRKEYSIVHRNFVCIENGDLLSFNFGCAYGERLLMHHALGGGKKSIDALKQLRLRGEMVARLRERISILGKHYVGIHVRHTDYKSDYKPFLRMIAKNFEEPHIALCTDSLEVLDYARSIFRQPVHNFCAFPDGSAGPLHTSNQLDKRETNTDSILDLFTLAKANTLFLVPISNGSQYHNSSGISGYSRLAGELKKNRPLLNALIS